MQEKMDDFRRKFEEEQEKLKRKQDVDLQHERERLERERRRIEQVLLINPNFRTEFILRNVKRL